jgi:hypothetical protein
MAQVIEKLISPCTRTFRPWRKVAGFTGAGETETHWQNGYLLRVVKDFARHPHPVTQTISACIIKRHAGFMNSFSWCLSRN